MVRVAIVASVGGFVYPQKQTRERRRKQPDAPPPQPLHPQPRAEAREARGKERGRRDGAVPVLRVVGAGARRGGGGQARGAGRARQGRRGRAAEVRYNFHKPQHVPRLPKSVLDGRGRLPLLCSASALRYVSLPRRRRRRLPSSWIG